MTVDLRNRLAAEAAAHGIPGAVVAVFAGGELHFECHGVTSLDNPLPVTKDTIFRLASLTKPFTATAAMRLVHLGKAVLDAPIVRYLPDLRLASSDTLARLTLHDLLTHKAGWLDDPLMEIDDPERNPSALAALPQLAPVGTVWSYSTTGFYIIGRLIEAVTGTSFGQALRDLLLKPLRLARTGVSAEQAITWRVALGHHKYGEELRVVRPWPPRRWDAAAQGLFSTPADIMRLALLHLDELPENRDESFLSKELIQLMQGPFSDDGTRGLGWFARGEGESRVIGHPGGLYGYAHDLNIAPARKVAVLTMANRSGHALDRSVNPWILDSVAGIKPEALRTVSLPEDQLVQYVGRYCGASRDLLVSVSGGSLHLCVERKSATGEDGIARPTRSKPLELRFLSRDRIVVEGGLHGGEIGQFHRDPWGQVTLLRFPNFLHVRQPSPIEIPFNSAKTNMKDWWGDDGD